MEYCQGGLPAGGCGKVLGGGEVVLGGRDANYNLDQAEVVGGRGRPLVEKVGVNILIFPFSILTLRLIWLLQVLQGRSH